MIDDDDGDDEFDDDDGNLDVEGNSREKQVRILNKITIGIFCFNIFVI